MTYINRLVSNRKRNQVLDLINEDDEDMKRDLLKSEEKNDLRNSKNNIYETN